MTNPTDTAEEAKEGREMSDIDFTKSRWGHAIHSSTFRHEGYRRSLTDRLLRREGVPQFSVMVHSAESIEIGKHFKYAAAWGINRAKIISYEQCSDPRDMFTLKFEIVERGVSQ